MPANDFTYDLSTDIGKMRLMLGDNNRTCGVKPNEAYFTDAELSAFFAMEGDSVNLGVALACETLSRLYSGQVDISVGPRRESLSQAADSWAARAATLRGTYGAGGTAGASGSFVTGFDRGTSGTDEFSR